MAISSILPPASSLVALSRTDRTQILSLLFEPSPGLTNLLDPLLATEEFTSYEDVIAAIKVQLHTLLTSPLESSQTLLTSILSSHPRLGENKVVLLSAQSAAEQASLADRGNSGASDAEQTKKLSDLNAVYEDRFGFRYVVFVNGRNRSAVLLDMTQRLESGTVAGERRAAINAMCDIACDRAKKLQANAAAIGVMHS